jgi:hypothetical protein
MAIGSSLHPGPYDAPCLILAQIWQLGSYGTTELCRWSGSIGGLISFFYFRHGHAALDVFTVKQLMVCSL